MRSSTLLRTGSLRTGRFFRGGSLKSTSLTRRSAAPSFRGGETFSLRFWIFRDSPLRTDTAAFLRLSRRCVFRQVLLHPLIFKWITTRATTCFEAQEL